MSSCLFFVLFFVFLNADYYVIIACKIMDKQQKKGFNMSICERLARFPTVGISNTQQGDYMWKI